MIWSAPAERSGDGALDSCSANFIVYQCGDNLTKPQTEAYRKSKAPSALRSAGALQNR